MKITIGDISIKISPYKKDHYWLEYETGEGAEISKEKFDKMLVDLFFHIL